MLLRKPSGYLIGKPYDGGPDIERDTLRCVHCQHVWIVHPGSGNQRGYCMNCGGPTCGAKACVEGCAPFEKQIEAWEQQAAHRALRGY